MKFVYSDISGYFDLDNGKINTLIIENPRFFRQVLEDIQTQIDGGGGKSVISIKDTPADFAKYAEILNTFVPFELNQKPLLSKIVSALEKNAFSGEHGEQSQILIRDMEIYLNSLAFDFPCDIIFPKLTISSIIKSVAPELRDEYNSLAEKILDYMELVRTFDKNKLFFTVNLRTYLTDEETELFSATALSHGYQILMLEGMAKEKLTLENRVIIDSDLCEIR